jgi:hypothetical protein
MADFKSVVIPAGATLVDFGVYAPKASKYDAPGAEPGYSARFLLDKVKHAAAIAKIRETTDQLEADSGLNKKPGVRKLLQDGDEVDSNGTRLHPDFYAGCVFMTAKSKAERPPTLQVGREKRAARPGDFFTGAEVAGIVSVFCYDNQSRGVSALLKLVWKTGVGKPIGDDGEAQAELDGLKVEWSAGEEDAKTINGDLEDLFA